MRQGRVSGLRNYYKLQIAAHEIIGRSLEKHAGGLLSLYYQVLVLTHVVNSLENGISVSMG